MCTGSDMCRIVETSWFDNYQVVGMQIWRCSGSMESLQDNKLLVPKSNSRLLQKV